jgi:predicted nucleotidyltransferase
LKKLLIDPLKQNGAQVWVFGSRARGDHKVTSDVDLLFEFPPNLIPKAGMLFSIKSDLEESRFPFTVDLVEVNKLAESYRDSVLSERKKL